MHEHLVLQELVKLNTWLEDKLATKAYLLVYSVYSSFNFFFIGPRYMSASSQVLLWACCAFEVSLTSAWMVLLLPTGVGALTAAGGCGLMSDMAGSDHQSGSVTVLHIHIIGMQ